MNQPVFTGRADGPFVKVHGIERAAFNTCDLRADQRSAILESLRGIVGPFLELAVVGSQGLPVVGPLRSGGPIAQCGTRQRAVEMVLCQLEERR